MKRLQTAAVLAALGAALTLAGCGAGSGRSGTDLAVTGTLETPALNGGDAVRFTLTVTNRGDFEARDVLIRNATLQLSPAALQIDCTASGGATCPTVTGVTMDLPVLPAGGSLVFEVRSTLLNGASGTFSNTMVVSSATADVNTANNSVTLSGTASSNDVAITAIPPTGPLVDAGAVFSMRVDNSGPDTAQSVRLSATLSNNLVFVPTDLLCQASGGASLPILQSGNDWLVETIPAGGALDCSFPVSVVAGTSGVTAVSLTATAAGDARAGNNTATASVGATLVHDIGVSGSAAAPSVPGGGSTVFTLVVNNPGPSAAYDVSLTNTLSSGLTLSGTIACTGAGGAQAPVATASGGLVSAAVPVGGVLTCTVPVTVTAGASGEVSTTFSATAPGETRPADNRVKVSTVAVSSNLGVSQSSEVQAPAGGALSFEARVNNPGPSAASNVQINWSADAPAGVAFAVPTCTPLGGAICPAVLGPSMSVDSLQPGRTLVFRFNATSAADVRGDVVSTVAVTADEDIDPSNNTASATTTVVDPRNGSYAVFAADGRRYDLVIDFDASTYTMSGNATSTVRAFVADAGHPGDYTVDGTARFRVAADLLVGGHDFGASVLPFVAARNFAGGLTALAGAYNLATRIVAADGTARTLPGTAFITGNTLSVCESETAQVTAVRVCATGARTDFLNLTLNGTTVTGTSGDGEIIRFSVVNSGAAKFLLSAMPTGDGGQRVRLGVVDSTGGLTFGPAQRGASTTGDWVTTTLVDAVPVAYGMTGFTTTDSANMGGIPGPGPISMLVGTSTATNGSIYLMQSYPLQIVVGGALPFNPTGTGLLQVTLP